MVQRDLSFLTLSLLLLTIALPAGAVPVPMDDEDGQTGGGGGDEGPGDPFEVPDGCEQLPALECQLLGGQPEIRGGECVCVHWEFVPTQVINADKGDVGLVPILPGSSSGNGAVVTVLRAIGQYHRHTVLFWDNGFQTRHNTMYFKDIDDGFMNGSDYVKVHTPLVGTVRLNEDQLRNGLPGAISQTVDDTLARGRLEYDGLLLKPALASNYAVDPITGEVVTVEPDRPLFEAAADIAIATDAYYKLSDYTSQTSMSLPFGTMSSSDADDGEDFKGSHCSGFIANAFNTAAGASIVSTLRFTAGRRLVAATALHDFVLAEARDGTGAWDDFFAAIFVHWSVAQNIANQTANCFAGRGCSDLSSGWSSLAGIGTGDANGPDNLLPTSFRLGGTESYNFDGNLLNVGDVSTEHEGTVSSPFGRVEAMKFGGGYWHDRVETSW